MTEATNAPRAVTTPEFDAAVLARSASVPVLVDFWAAWCAPCRALAPIVDRLAQAFAGRAEVVKVDTDAEAELAARYGVRSLPTIALFRHGKLVDAVIGAQPEGVLREMLERHVDRPSDAERIAALAIAKDGDVAAAVATLERLVAAEPDRVAHFYALIDVLLESGQRDAAADRLGHLPVSLEGDPEIARRRARLELLRAAADTAEDTRARADAARRFLAGEHDGAMDRWLELMRTAREREPAQRLLRAAFTLLDDEARVLPYRRRMASALH
jgi:putative thioredoxin